MNESPVETNPDGLYLAAAASLARLMGDDLLRSFADGLLPRAAAVTLPAEATIQPLAHALFSPEPAFGGVLAAFLALDADIITPINGDRRVWPLPGFLSYRSRLAGHQPDSVRLPPLNPGGHYLLTLEDNTALVLRFDLHPRLWVAGHIRIAIASNTTPPQRLTALEHRLERRTLSRRLLHDIKIAGSAGDLAIDPTLVDRLLSLLQEFTGENE